MAVNLTTQPGQADQFAFNLTDLIRANQAQADKVCKRQLSPVTLATHAKYDALLREVISRWLAPMRETDHLPESDDDALNELYGICDGVKKLTFKVEGGDGKTSIIK